MLNPGTMVAGYRVTGVLGEGRMGVVYAAVQLSLNRTIALKLLAAETSEDPTFRERFRREGLLQALIEHPNIVTVYEAGEADQGLFLAMRVVKGPTLKELIQAGPLDPARTVRILGPVAQALDTAHEAGLIHRDVKPQNILLDDRDHPYLADFGLTKAHTEPGQLTETGQFIGTIDYISPEQMSGEPATVASDVYALASVLYECLTGQVPFAKPTEAAVLFAHMTEDPPSATAQRPDLPASIDAVIAAGMAKEPSERPPSASALMRRAAEALGVSAIETVAATPPARRRTALIAGVVAAVAVVAVIAGFLLGGSGGGDGALNSSASAGNIQLNFPDGWERRTGSGGIPGLDLPLPLVLAPPGQSDDVIVAGRANQPGPGLLPRELTRLLPRRPRGEAVRLGRFEALRYADLRPFGLDGMATVFAVPTTTGVVLVGCRDRGSPSFGEDCERVAGTLRVLRAKPVRLPPEH